MTIGYSGKPLAAKLGLEVGGRLAAVDAPDGYRRLLEPLPEGATVTSLSWRDAVVAPVDVLHLFVRDQAGLALCVADLTAGAPAGGMLWISWPKKGSPLFRDLTEDGIRALVLPTGWVDVKVAAVDADWSGLKFLRQRT